MYYYMFRGSRDIFGPFDTPRDCLSDARSSSDNIGRTMIILVQHSTAPVLGAVSQGAMILCA